jgi:inner membrane protein
LLLPKATFALEKSNICAKLRGMDNLTHGLLGMAVAVCIAPRESRRQAAWVGFLAGEFPDLDVFLRSADDPLFGLAMHRHFTHSLLLAPLIGVAMAYLVIAWQRWRKKVFHARVLMFAGIAAALSHGLCDVWTSYGTRWFWPFADTRVAWDLISVIDPLFTLPLLLLVPFAVVKRSRKLSAIALGWVVAYLSLCFFQQQRVLDAASELAEQRGHQPEKLCAKPSFGNIVVWRALYQQEGRAYVVCLRAGAQVKVLGQSDAELVDAQKISSVPNDSVLARDIQRFAHFSDNWLAWHPQQPGVLGDLRYALRPDTIEPLWGISVDFTKPEQHVDFLTFRRTRSDSWQVLWQMIRHGNVSH